MRALKLIRGKKPSFSSAVMFAEKSEITEGAEAKNTKCELVWQPRPEWLRKPGSRQNLWN